MDFINHVKEQIANPAFGFKKQDELLRTILRTANRLGKTNGETNIAVSFKPQMVIFKKGVDGGSNDVGAVLEIYHPNQPTGAFIFDKEECEKDFKKCLKEAKMRGEEVLYFNNFHKIYCMSSFAEFVKNINGKNIQLKPEHIHTYTWGKQKYYLLTYTPINSNSSVGFSPTEMAFGRFVDGFTYVVKKEHWREYRATL